MLKRIRKSSGRVTLVLIGLASVAGCGGEGESRRDVYASREDCLADWGNKPEDCTPATQPRHSSGHYFYGPSYSSRSGSGWGSGAGSSRSGSRALSSVTGSHGGSSSVSRGGFGSSSRSSSG